MAWFWCLSGGFLRDTLEIRRLAAGRFLLSLPGRPSALEKGDDTTAPDAGRQPRAGEDSSENYPSETDQQARPRHAGAYAHAVARSPLRPSRAARTPC